MLFSRRPPRFLKPWRSIPNNLSFQKEKKTFWTASEGEGEHGTEHDAEPPTCVPPQSLPTPKHL